jgi:hypothetical protein
MSRADAVDRLADTLAAEARNWLAEADELSREIAALAEIAARALVDHELPDLLVAQRRLEREREALLTMLDSLTASSVTVH